METYAVFEEIKLFRTVYYCGIILISWNRYKLFSPINREKKKKATKQ